jgi:hypothetical protein
MSHRPLLRRFPHILLFFPRCPGLQIFVQSFVASQKSKDKHWLTQSCKDADLEVDENLAAELGARDSDDDVGM